MPPKPNRPNGQHGAHPSNQFRTALTAALGDDADREAKIHKIAERLVECAEKGEPWAIKMVAERLDGRPHQAVSVGADDGAGLTVQVVHYSEVEAIGRLMQRIDGKSRGLPEPRPNGNGASEHYAGET